MMWIVVLVTLLVGGDEPRRSDATFVNADYGYSVAYPAHWESRRTSHRDPDAMVQEGGEPGSMSPDTQRLSNAVWFNLADPAPRTRPSIVVYAHWKPGMSFDNHRELMVHYLERMRQPLVSATRVQAGSLTGFAYVYGQGIHRTKLVVFFTGGRRISLMYSGYGDPFEKFEREFDAVVASLKVSAK